MPNATALLFPGQGSQTAEMGERTKASCPALVEHAEMLVGADLFDRVGESTYYAQPAIFCASLARFEALGRPAAAAYAGHSLGELTALTAAGAVDAGDALWLVTVRAAAMAEAGDADRDGMLALLKGTPERAAELAAAFSVTLANDNAPGQTVVSGPVEGLAALAAQARAEGIRAMQLDVAGAFHSPAMASAIPAFEGALRSVEFREPRAPVYSGMTARPFCDVRRELADALTSPVRWRETVIALEHAGVDRFLDVGPGAVLARLVSRTVEGPEVLAAEELADAAA